MTQWEIIAKLIAWRRDYPSRRHSFWPDRHSRAFVGFPWYRGIEQFHQTRLIRITHWRLAIWLDPLGMLDPQVTVNLLQ
jgi:hypothetical protein